MREHNRGFRFIGGIPRKVRYDNSKISVAKIPGSRERQVTKEFIRVQGREFSAQGRSQAAAAGNWPGLNPASLEQSASPD